MSITVAFSCRQIIAPAILRLFVVVGLSLCAFAEPAIGDESECGDFVLNSARKFYEIGQFQQVFSAVEPCLLSNGFSDREKVQAYRYLSMSYLVLDSSAASVAAAAKLLKYDPNFEPDIFDPPAFVALVRNLKQNAKAVLVTSVSKKAENILEAIATVSVLSQEDIRRRGYIDLEAMVSDLSGFDVSRTFGPTYSNIYQRGYRSNNTDRTIFLVDGVEENDLWSNITYLSRQYPITSVNRVEIVYGPASTMYGANAFVGVINVITKNPDEYILPENNWGASAHVSYGTWNTRYADVTVAGRQSGVALSLTGRVFRSDEMDLSRFPDYDYSVNFYDNIDYSFLNVTRDAAKFVRENKLADGNSLYAIERNGNGDTTAVVLTQQGKESARTIDKEGIQQTVNGSKIRYGNIADQYLLNGKLKIGDFMLGFQEWRTVAGGTTYFTDNNEAGANNGSLWVPKQTFFYVQYEKTINDNLSISNLTQYKIHQIDGDSKAVYLLNYSNGSRSFLDLLSGKQAVWITEWYYQLSKQLRNELKILWAPSTSFDVVSGLEIRNSILQGNYLISYDGNPSELGASGTNQLGGNYYEINDIGVYAQASYRAVENLKLSAGLRVDNNTIRENGGYGTVFNPRLAVVWSVDDFILKGVYATAFKDASNWTKFATNPSRRAPNPNLDPERVSNIEIAALWKINPDALLEVVGYDAEYSGVIGTGIYTAGANDPFGLPEGTRTGQNQPLGSLRIQGIQINISWKMDNRFSWYANATASNPKNTKDESGTEEKRIGDIADYRINFGANYVFFDRLNVNLRANYIGPRPTGPGTSVSLNPFHFDTVFLLNGAISYENAIPGLTIQAIINNITDLEYFDPGIRSADGGFYSGRTPQRERSIMVRLLYDF